MGHVLEAVSVRAESDGPERAQRNLPGVGCGAPRKSARLAACAIPNRTSPTRVHEPTRCRRRTPHSVSPRAPPPSAASPRRCARAAVRPRARQRSSLSAPRARAPRTPADRVRPSRPVSPATDAAARAPRSRVPRGHRAGGQGGEARPRGGRREGEAPQGVHVPHPRFGAGDGRRGGLRAPDPRRGGQVGELRRLARGRR